MKRLLTLFTKISLVTLTLAAISMPATVQAGSFFDSSKDQVCKGTNAVGADGCSADAGSSVNRVIRNVINLFSIVVGVVAVVMIIVAGIKFITSGGESSNVASAKSTILYAVIGLVVVALAQTIARFVLTKAG